MKYLTNIQSHKSIQGIRSNRVSEELWMEVWDTVQEAVIKTISKKKKSKKAKWLSKEALQISWKKGDATQGNRQI